jgi:peptide/nickel transport system substrate-binding protein
MSDKKNKNTQHNNELQRDRRDFLKTSALVGMAGVAFSVGMPLTGWAQDATPKAGGVLRLGLTGAGSGDSYDPGTWNNAFLLVGFPAVYNTLVEIDTDGSALPELAEGWETSSDAKVWTFKLRKGITFHNGKDLVAEDIVASINHHRGESSTSIVKSLLSSITSVRAHGNDSVVIELSAGNVDFPYVVSDYHLVIMPANNGVADWRSGIGTGGYRIKSFDPGVRMMLERNGSYWKPNRAHFEGAEIISISDGAARINALVTGEVDVIDKVDLKTADLLKRNPRVVLEQTKNSMHYTFPMMTDSQPFQNNDIRMALKHAIDREAMLKKVLRGYGQIGNDHPIPPSDRFFNQTIAQRQYDPDKARFYLRKAGIDRLKVKLQTTETVYSGAVDAAVLFQENARKAGIEIDVAREPADGYWNNVWGKQPFCASYFYNRPTADQMFSIGYGKGATWNDTHWENERFNKLLINARSELNETLRGEMYHEMQQLVHDNNGNIIPVYANSVAARSTRVAHGNATSPFGILDGLRAIERWWMA